MVRAHRYNCHPKTAEQWAALGCVFANPSGTTAFDLSTHNRVTHTTSCEVSCPDDGEDFVVTRVTGLTAITDNNIQAAVDEWVVQPAIAAAKYAMIFGDLPWLCGDHPKGGSRLSMLQHALDSLGVPAAGKGGRSSHRGRAPTAAASRRRN